MLKYMVLCFFLVFCLGATYIVSPGTFGSNNRCKSYVICEDEAGTGACQDDTNTHELVAHLQGRSNITFDSTASGASVWSCDLFTNSTGYTVTAGDKQQISTTALSNTNKVISYTQGPLLYVWAECGINTGTDIDVTVVACE